MTTIDPKWIEKVKETHTQTADHLQALIWEVQRLEGVGRVFEDREIALREKFDIASRALFDVLWRLSVDESKVAIRDGGPIFACKEIINEAMSKIPTKREDLK